MGAADGRQLSDDFLGVYTVGFADRAAHVAQLADGPTVSDYSLSDTRLMVLSVDMVLLAYRAEFRRPRQHGAGVSIDQLDLAGARRKVGQHLQPRHASAGR